MKAKPWKKVGETKILASSRGRRLFVENYQDPHTGEVHDFTMFGADGSASVVLALTVENKVLAVKQYRPANNLISLELPGGSNKFPGQTPVEIAKEELAEETGGYAPETIISLCPKEEPLVELMLRYPIHPFLFLRCRKTNHQAKPDPAEYVETVEIPLSEWIEKCQDGQIRDIKSLAITFLALKFLRPPY